MFEFDNLIYLDLPKTGSTRIEAALIANFGLPSAGAPHVPFRGESDKLRVISVREPCALYVSLFRYGCDGRGRLFQTLKAAGLAGLYRPTGSALNIWLEFILSAPAAPFFGPSYCPDLCGPMTHRLLRLMWSRADRRLQEARTREALRKMILQPRLWPEYMIRLEHLEGDMLRMLRREGLLRVPVPDLRAVFRDPRFENAARSGQGLHKGLIRPALRQQIMDREWAFYRLFGYDWDIPPKGPRLRPPDYDDQPNMARRSTVSRTPISAQ